MAIWLQETKNGSYKLSDETLQLTHFLGVANYIAALDTICGNARNNLFIFDKDFINCGFNSQVRVEKLNKFLLSNPNNRLLLLAHDIYPLSQHCPRLMSLLRQFSHNMLIYQTPKHLQNLSEPFVVADELQYARRFHFNDNRGVIALNDGEGAHRLKIRFMEMWAESSQNISTATFSL